MWMADTGSCMVAHFNIQALSRSDMDMGHLSIGISLVQLEESQHFGILCCYPLQLTIRSLCGMASSEYLFMGPQIQGTYWYLCGNGVHNFASTQ